ncbi:TroA family protein [Thiohalobacter thiocyanaticus]|uniref:Fe/B12 periplasmic-binding domain-containing protein n=1 Tax=Thiohalobacter thiocyanaticus TaxID=585455 RepID=A0A426QL39_9GAMM|nr:hypothetical protein [Thiohalobacter thiocyanaticus]RRQ22417.1 hypothetical protein D6C00_10985 [Thiohalobacter thiocyanaticus]
MLEDDTGYRLELPAPAQRIVTLAPFLTELAYAAGAGDRLVGAVAFSDFPGSGEPFCQRVGRFQTLEHGRRGCWLLEPDLVRGL